ncbi:MAG: tetratricopeptide repeat protein, partial [Bacteroidota bacterium]
GVKLQPHNDSLLLDLSVCYFQLHWYEKAMQTTEQILRRHPQHPRALLNKGVLFAVQNKPNEATITWNRLINHSPGTEEAEQARQYLAQLKRQ